MFEYLFEFDNFVASKQWLFVPITAVFLIFVLINILNVVRQGLCAFVFPHLRSTDLKRYGEWAVVTGGTDGIGKEYCRCLAEKGLNIIVVSRDSERLQKTSSELINEYGVKVSTVRVDFRKGWELQEELAAQLKGKKIGILVNNVGKAIDVRRNFHCQKSEAIVDLITVNVESFLIMTTLVLPQMVRRRNGAIVAMSSLSGQINTPMIAVYGASKATMTALSRALYYEYRNLGVEFQCLIPSCVTTKISLIKTCSGLPSWIFPDAYTYCKNAVATLGYTSYTTGYLPHSLKWLLVDRHINDFVMFMFKKFVMKHQLRRG